VTPEKTREGGEGLSQLKQDTGKPSVPVQELCHNMTTRPIMPKNSLPDQVSNPDSATGQSPELVRSAGTVAYYQWFSLLNYLDKP